jgi:hypothetical protein
MTANYDNLTEEQEQYLDRLKAKVRTGSLSRPEELAYRLEIVQLEEFDPQYIDKWQPLYTECIGGVR